MNKDKKAKDPKRNNIFAAAFDYLKRTTDDIKTQQDLADKMGVTKDTVSRILRAKTDVTEDAITKLQTASGCIFNLQWLRGESDIMLANDAEKKSAPVAEIQHHSAPMPMPDYSSLMNATIAAQETSIASLKRELADKEESAAKAEASFKRELAAKEETITAIRSQLATKDAQLKDKDARLADKQSMIATLQEQKTALQEQLADLRRQLAASRSNDILGNYPFSMGAAEESNRPSARK